MRFAILSLVAAGALAVSAGTADAQYRGFNNYYGGYRGGYNSFYRGVPNYGFNRGFQNYSGFSLTIGGARGGFVSPGFGYGYNNFYRPYYGGWNGGFNRGFYGNPWRW